MLLICLVVLVACGLRCESLSLVATTSVLIIPLQLDDRSQLVSGFVPFAPRSSKTDPIH